MTLLSIRDLTIRYERSPRPVVDTLSFSIAKGDSVGLVGASGSGKTQTALAILGLLHGKARTTGSIRYAQQELVGASERVLNNIRARRIAMVFQDPGTALNPYLRIGTQLRQVVLQHRLATGAEVNQRVIRMLAKTGLPDPQRQFNAYPHQLSGGMRQRVMIASALLGEPELLIADEPTTAIDATVQAQILALLRELRQETGTALLLITHDLAIVAGNCARTLVLHDGRLLEEGSTQTIFARPVQERTRSMLAAVREGHGPAAEFCASDRGPTLQVRDLTVSYTEPASDRFWGRSERVAVQPLSVGIRRGETVAIVGESGCGKTSLARAILGLVPARGGSVRLFGRDLSPQLRGRNNTERRNLQLVFQNPVASLNPALRIKTAIAEPLKIHEPELTAAERAERVARMLERVNLDDELLERLPHELSGGQAQRVAIARALIVRPALLICDEAVASLDGPVRQGILDLLAEEQRRSALSIIFISHDLNIVRQISHRVLVMYMGRIVETSVSRTLFSKPLHPYSRALIDCVPVPDPGVMPPAPPVTGEAPSVFARPDGCVFHPRCRYAVERCKTEMPHEECIGGTLVACHRAAELDLSPARRVS
ncbi:MAG: dipeptide ABC transporter ATP-binding protein [Gammaproteobacteria bacterium]|nr:dipeptide ABC transporter ATP-binding protein [Gammaproteobacteria bacterium]